MSKQDNKERKFSCLQIADAPNWPFADFAKKQKTNHDNYPYPKKKNHDNYVSSYINNTHQDFDNNMHTNFYVMADPIPIISFNRNPPAAWHNS